MTKDIDSGLQPGTYRHYKGGEYQVIGLARHSETEELLVVYHPLYTDSGKAGKDLWVRPLSMFRETVELNGERIPRFKYLGRAS